MKYKKIPKFNMENFEKRINKTEGCWWWIGTIRPDGYGNFYINSRIYLAHRVSYSYYKDLNDGMVIDHICRNRRCVNPEHLRNVSLATNTTQNSKSWACRNKEKTHCNRGHELSDSNVRIDTDGARRCKKCAVITTRNCRARKRLKCL